MSKLRDWAWLRLDDARAEQVRAVQPWKQDGVDGGGKGEWVAGRFELGTGSSLIAAIFSFLFWAEQGLIGDVVMAYFDLGKP